MTIAAVGRRFFPEKCDLPCIGGAGGACVFAILAFIAVAAGDGQPLLTGRRHARWISAGNVVANFSLRADGLTAASCS